MKKYRIALFMTFDVSLREWNRLGILQRELDIYRELTNESIELTIFSYGDDDEHKYLVQSSGVRVLPVYSKLRRPSRRSIRFIQSFLIPWVFRKEIRNMDLLKTNQMFGSWVPAVAKVMFRTPLIVRCGYELSACLLDAGANRYIVLVSELLSKYVYRFSDHRFLFHIL